jgi:hypothetical protein
MNCSAPRREISSGVTVMTHYRQNRLFVACTLVASLSSHHVLAQAAEQFSATPIKGFIYESDRRAPSVIARGSAGLIEVLSARDE